MQGYWTKSTNQTERRSVAPFLTRIAAVWRVLDPARDTAVITQAPTTQAIHAACWCFTVRVNTSCSGTQSARKSLDGIEGLIQSSAMA